MKKFLRKTLIYLLAIGMLCPAWLATGVLKATHAKAAPVNPVLTEIYISGDQEWVEFYNPNDFEFNLGGGYIKTSLTSTKFSFPFVETSYDTFTINSDVVIPSVSSESKGIAVLKDTDFNKPLNFSDLSAKKELSATITYFSADGTALQGTADYSKWLNSNVTDGSKSFHYDVATEKWGVADTDKLKYESEKASISISVDPAKNADKDKFTVTVNYLNAAEGNEFYRVLKDGSVLKDWGGYSDPVEFTDAGKYTFEAESNGIMIGDTAFASAEFTIDKTKPVISLLGDSDITVEQGSVYKDLGATALDDLDGDITSGIISVNSVNMAVLGTYTVTYNVTDEAGNNADQVTRTVNVVEKALVSPDFTVTPVNGKTFKIEWIGNGADSYVIKVNGKTDPNGVIVKNATEKYSKEITVSDYGNYEVSLVAVRSGIESTDNKTHSVELKAPVVTPAETPAPVATVGPAKAQAAAPSQENTVQTPSDDNGQIKGDETKSNDEDKTNWTPWIVLFVLIILAGAATGGYFYWFNGEEEVKTVVREVKKPEVKKAPVVTKTTKKSNNQKKQKRW